MRWQTTEGRVMGITALSPRHGERHTVHGFPVPIVPVTNVTLVSWVRSWGITNWHTALMVHVFMLYPLLATTQAMKSEGTLHMTASQHCKSVRTVILFCHQQGVWSNAKYSNVSCSPSVNQGYTFELTLSSSRTFNITWSNTYQILHRLQEGHM